MKERTQDFIIQPLCGSCNSSKRDKYIDLKPKGLYSEENVE